MKIKRESRSPLFKKAKHGFRGYPVATVAFYGPDDSRATKVAVAIVPREGADPEALERWFADALDVRDDPRITHAIMAFLRSEQAKSVVLSDGIIGCPHEETVDYPEGETCPQCPFWAGRDRWSGEFIH